MSVFRRFFPNKQQRQRVAQARQMIEHAIRKPREPKGCAASAESGADLRDRLLAVVEDVEKEIGDLAVIIAADGTLIHPRLIEVLEKRRDDGELLRLAINSCFVNPNTKQAINETWPTAVARYQSRPNDDKLVDEKATALAAFVAHNLDTAIEVRNALLGANDKALTDEQEQIVKIEEAACWYRMIDELAYRFIPDHRNLFAGLFLDHFAYSLALQGTSPDFVCQMMTARSEEYAQYRDWVADDNQSVAGTLLWNAAKHVAVPLGCEHDPIFATSFGTLFINRVAQALVYELLTGKQRAPAK